MKKQVLTALATFVLCLSSGAWAQEDPQLKFDSEALDKNAADKSEAKESKYGDKPLLKLGNDKNYVKFGGYGSFRFSADTAEGVNNTFTLRRFVLTLDALVASKLRMYTEIEFERFRKIELERSASLDEGGVSLEQEFEGTNGSEIAMEQIWFELAFKDYLRVRGGGVLVPLGRFNIDHDDNRWNLPRRSLIDRGVPVLLSTSAWDELGIGLNGDVELGEKSKLSYQVYVVNGATLDFELEQAIKSHGPDRDELEVEGSFGVSTGTFSQDIKDAKAVTGRLAYSPALGHEIGVSGYWGRYTPDFLIGKNAVSFGLDWLSQFKNFDIEAEYLYTHLGGLDAVLNDFASKVGNTEAEVDPETSPDLESKIAFKPSSGLASTKQGYWLELRYHFRPQWLTNSWFGDHFSDPQLIPVLRIEQAFISGLITDYEVIGGKVATLGKENRRVDRFTAGLAFRLNPLAVFSLAYEYTQTNKGKALGTVTNYLPTSDDRNNSFMFGAAFGF